MSSTSTQSSTAESVPVPPLSVDQLKAENERLSAEIEEKNHLILGLQEDLAEAWTIIKYQQSSQPDASGIQPVQDESAKNVESSNLDSIDSRVMVLLSRAMIEYGMDRLAEEEAKEEAKAQLEHLRSQVKGEKAVLLEELIQTHQQQQAAAMEWMRRMYANDTNQSDLMFMNFWRHV